MKVEIYMNDQNQMIDKFKVTGNPEKARMEILINDGTYMTVNSSKCGNECVIEVGDKYSKTGRKQTTKFVSDGNFVRFFDLSLDSESDRVIQTTAITGSDLGISCLDLAIESVPGIISSLCIPEGHVFVNNNRYDTQYDDLSETEEKTKDE